MEELNCDFETSKNLAQEFAVRYTNLLLKKKEIDAQIKDLKKEFEEQGLPTRSVIKVINTLKREKKTNPSILDEEEQFKEWLSVCTDLSSNIESLNGKVE